MCATTVLLPTPEGPESTVSRAGRSGTGGGPVIDPADQTDSVRRSVGGATELALERRDLVGTQPADAAALGDAEPLHDLLGPHLADAGHRLQQGGDLHLADDL